MPAGPFLRPVVFGLVVAAVLGAGAEVFWRSQGHLPTSSGEDLDLWALERRRASNNDAKTLVILGKSRAQLDLDLVTLRARYPDHRIVQLALRGRGAFAAFEDLCLDERFQGRILWSLTEDDLARSEADGQRPAVERAKAIGPDARLNARLRAEVASRLVVRATDLEPHRVLKNLVRGRLPTPQFILGGPDRGAAADFTRIDVALIRGQVEEVQAKAMRRMGGGRLRPEAWLSDVRRLLPLVSTLRGRGGDVALVHLPVTESSLQFSMRFYPKQAFWDRLGPLLGVTAVHFRDEEQLRGYKCPDTSHLDKGDAPRFTADLLDVLEARGFPPR